MLKLSCMMYWGNLHEVKLYNALYIPSYHQNIFSVSAEVGIEGAR